MINKWWDQLNRYGFEVPTKSFITWMIQMKIIKDSREAEDVFRLIGENSLVLTNIKKIHFEKVFVKSMFKGAVENSQICIETKKELENPLSLDVQILAYQRFNIMKELKEGTGKLII
jgi:hypothetical protein